MILSRCERTGLESSTDASILPPSVPILPDVIIRRAGAEAEDNFVESASMEATFASVKRTLVVGLFTAGVVVAGLLLSGGASVAVTMAVVGAMVATRFCAAWTAEEGLKAETVVDQRRWTRRLEYALIPMGALSGVAPSVLPQVDGRVSPQWFGLLVCSVAVIAANVLVGYGRSRTFLAVTGPVVVGSALSAGLVGGEFALFFGPGAVIVGGILMLDNREAGVIFRDARRLEEQNRSLVSELQSANLLLQHRVHTDVLTGLSNRAGLRLHIAALADTDEIVEVIYIDLDGFKAVNDDHGHAAGDAVLAAIGERLNRIVRSEDCAARLGGDEFAVIASGDGTSSRRLSDRIRESLGAPILVGDLEITLGASIGSHHAKPGDDIGLAMRLADAAMYDQKRGRRRTGGDLIGQSSEQRRTETLPLPEKRETHRRTTAPASSGSFDSSLPASLAESNDRSPA